MTLRMTGRPPAPLSTRLAPILDYFNTNLEQYGAAD